MKATYRIFKVSHPKRLSGQGLELVNENGVITKLTQVNDYQGLEAVKKIIGCAVNRKNSNGLKLAKPIVHTDKKYLVVKLGA
jgi:hypothetical protein